MLYDNIMLWIIVISIVMSLALTCNVGLSCHVALSCSVGLSGHVTLSCDAAKLHDTVMSCDIVMSSIALTC